MDPSAYYIHPNWDWIELCAKEPRRIKVEKKNKPKVKSKKTKIKDKALKLIMKGII